jgi:hypothetical protein
VHRPHQPLLGPPLTETLFTNQGDKDSEALRAQRNRMSRPAKPRETTVTGG